MDTLFTALRVALSLALIIGLLWYVQRRSAKWARGKAYRPITVVGKQSLGGKARVVIVEADGNRFVLGVTDSSVVVLNAREAVSFADALAAEEVEGAVDAGEAAESPRPAVTPAPAFTRHRDSATRGRRAARPTSTASITSAATWKKAALSLRNSP